MFGAMIRQIAPQFFATNLPATLTYCRANLARIHFRCADPPLPSPDRYADELLDAYLFVEDADAPWHTREFVVKDCDD